MNNTGDILETALILGRWGCTEYFQDAERILRCHLLPSQLRDISWIPTPDNPEGLDTLHRVAERTQGAWGFPTPFGHQPLEQRDGGRFMRFNTDVVGGTVGSLCEALREATRFDEAGHWVNLLFDHETPEVEVLSPYTHSALSVRVKTPGPLFVRIPPWCDIDAVQIEGASEKPRVTNGYFFLARPPVNRPITFRYDHATEETRASSRDAGHPRPAAGRRGGGDGESRGGPDVLRAAVGDRGELVVQHLSVDE